MKKLNIYIGNSSNLLFFRTFDIGIKLLLICMIFTFNAVITPLLAQQDLHFTQQIFSRMNVNPAATGNTADVDIFLLGRLQWLGVDDAPKSTLLNASNYFEKIKSGVGLSISFDKLGIGHSSTDIKAAYSFQLDLNDKWVLAMGVSGGAFIGSYNPLANSLVDETERDQMDNYKERETVVTPDFNIGIEANSLNWTLGFSITHLLNSESTSYASDRHIYAYASRAIMFNHQWDMLINLAYMNRNKVHLPELGVMGFYQRFIWGGFSWRPDIINKCNPSYLSVMAGAELKIFRLGYVYEFGVGSNNTLPPNTHEVIISFRIPKNKKN